MPPNVPSPEECELEEARWNRLAKQEGIHEKMKKYYEDYGAVGPRKFDLECPRTEPFMPQQERSRSPISVKAAKEHVVSKDGAVTYMYWMQARNTPKYDTPFQKACSLTLGPLMACLTVIHQCILSYLSDLYLCVLPFITCDAVSFLFTVVLVPDLELWG